MKKIAIITLHRVRNYGSVLQTYATQKVLSDLNTDPVIIDYYRKDQKKEDLLDNTINISGVFNRNFLTRIIGKIVLKKTIDNQLRVYSSFLDNNIKLTDKKYYSFNELEENPPVADIYLTGSDQVWNSTWNKGIDKAYFLEFVPKGKRRVAYAASIGKEKLDEEEKEITKEMLEKYEFIGVRESSAKEIINDLGIKKNVEHVLDPTLLLNKKEWEKFEVDIPEKGKDYILVYQLNSRNKEFDRYVKNLSKNKKIKVIRVSNQGYQKIKYGKFKNCPTVEEFISYFINAKYIVTDSFHATAFAINFNKQFVDIFPPKFSKRLQSILDLTGLQDRKIEDFNNFDIIEKKIDYTKVNKIMEDERKKSIEFLKKEIS